MRAAADPRPERAARAARRRYLARFGLVAPALLFLAVFLILPYVNIIVMSARVPGVGVPYGVGYTADNYLRVLTDAYFLQILADTVLLGVMTTLICLIIGYPVAYHLARTQSRWKGVLYVFVLSPLLVGVVVRSFGWLILLSGNGVINQALVGSGLFERMQLMNNRFGVTLALVHVFLPFMILPLVGNLQSIDPTLETAGRSLGATRFQVFRRIVLPLSMPGIQAGSILVFVLTLSAYVTPVMLGGAQVRTMSVLVVQRLIDGFQWPLGAALALVLSLTGALAVGLYMKLSGRFMRGVA